MRDQSRENQEKRSGVDESCSRIEMQQECGSNAIVPQPLSSHGSPWDSLLQIAHHQWFVTSPSLTILAHVCESAQ
jgi:hypothetical protein